MAIHAKWHIRGQTGHSVPGSTFVTLFLSPDKQIWFDIPNGDSDKA